MTKKPPPPQPIIWSVFKIAAPQTWLGTVEADDELEAIEKAAAIFQQSPAKLIVVRRG
jgi:hypothetical protein